MKMWTFNKILSVIFLTLVFGMAILSVIWLPFNPEALDLRARLQPPSAVHWLGTDEFGRDVASRLIKSATTSVRIASFTVIFASILGVILGSVAGFLGGYVDRIIMIVNDAIMAFPGILLALGLMMVFGPGEVSLVLALGLAYTPIMLRVVRGAVLSIRQLDYIEASVVTGNGAVFTMFRHVLPNAIAPIVVLCTSMFGWALLAESALSFLGLGVPAPAPTWGNMLSASRPYMDTALWLSLPPGICISIALLGVNLAGDHLRDVFDPRMARTTS